MCCPQPNGTSRKQGKTALQTIPGGQQDNQPHTQPFYQHNCQSISKHNVAESRITENELFQPNTPEYWARRLNLSQPVEIAPDLLERNALAAWRNSSRCIGRLPWRSLRVVDARSASSAFDVFDAIMEHIIKSTNNGSIVPMITIFPGFHSGTQRIRIWNTQFLAYAGYRKCNGRILGDPLNHDLTNVALSLGWRPRRSPTRFDLLPIIVQIGSKLEYFDLPEETVLRIPLRHPNYRWFAQLNLEWYALPAISSMILVTPSEIFPAAPFSGWYMSTEIGVRNLGDSHRYNQTPIIARHMGWDPRERSQLWRDRSLLILNEAVLFSFEKAGVRMTDHHTASKNFLKFLESESATGRCPAADWSWIVPPISSAATGVFQQSMRIHPRLPNFVPSRKPWATRPPTASGSRLGT